MSGGILWDVDPAIVRTASGFEIRYYSALLVLGVGLAIVVADHFLTRRGMPPKRVSWMFGWTGLAALIGGHLAHLCLYEPEALEDVGRLVNVGSGLASHGAAVSALAVVALHARIHRADPRAYFDALLSGAVFLIPFVRLGNLLNSEIAGVLWDGPWAFVCPRYDCFQLRLYADLPVTCEAALPRHPWPIYDALGGLGLIALAIALQARGLSRRRPGAIFLALWLTWFAWRFFVGFLNEAQVSYDERSAIHVEQWASLCAIAIGPALLAFARRLAPNETDSPARPDPE